MASRNSRGFIEVDHAQVAKHGQLVSGDVFLCQKIQEEDRVIAVLSDGLGSGIKASVLANLTATMALKYTSSFMDIKRSAETIMNTLPVCSVRRISYSTFTILDVQGSGEVRLIEYDNPPFLLVRGGREQHIESTPIAVESAERSVRYASFRVQLGDRIVFFSDGVSQAGMGRNQTPLGWGRNRVAEFVTGEIAADPRVSARDLAQRMVAEAGRLDASGSKDDTTAAVLYFREPRRLAVITGPPFSPVRDRELAELARIFPGRRVICGGTTANIISRLLHRELAMDLSVYDPEIPPAASMEGIDLITEGTLTLGRVAAILEAGGTEEPARPNAATRLAGMLLDSDVVHFEVGTRINQAHQDPNIPVELDLRRNVVKRIGSLLEQRFMKEVHFRYR
jgi:hypothetical protein